jgi:hypothetical protein
MLCLGSLAGLWSLNHDEAGRSCRFPANRPKDLSANLAGWNSLVAKEAAKFAEFELQRLAGGSRRFRFH